MLLDAAKLVRGNCLAQSGGVEVGLNHRKDEVSRRPTAIVSSPTYREAIRDHHAAIVVEIHKHPVSETLLGPLADECRLGKGLRVPDARRHRENLLSIELFERTADAGGRLLRAEQLVSADASLSSNRGPGFLLTFDVGRILVAADTAQAQLLLRQVESAEALSVVKLRSLDEEEPWWRLAGNPLTRAWPGGVGSGAASPSAEVDEIRLQFRADQENPKVISFRYDAGAVQIALDPTED